MGSGVWAPPMLLSVSESYLEKRNFIGTKKKAASTIQAGLVQDSTLALDTMEPLQGLSS